MHKYVELLKMAEKVIKQLSTETQTMVHQMNQAKIDHESVLGQLAKKRQELAVLENEHKASIQAYVDGVQRINEDANRTNAEAHALKAKLAHELNEATKARLQAEAIRNEVERERREFYAVNKAKKAVGV